MGSSFDSRKFVERWKQRKEKEEWLFALAVVKAGLEREGNLDEDAEKEIAAAREAFDISAKELDNYIMMNRRRLLRFLDS